MLTLVVAAYQAWRLLLARAWKAVVPCALAAAVPMAGAVALSTLLQYVDDGETGHLRGESDRHAQCVDRALSELRAGGHAGPARSRCGDRAAGARALRPGVPDSCDQPAVLLPGGRAGSPRRLRRLALRAFHLHRADGPRRLRVRRVLAPWDGRQVQRSWPSRLLSASSPLRPCSSISTTPRTCGTASRGAGFRLTVLLSPPRSRRSSGSSDSRPPDALVQVEPTVRGRDTWAYVPAFAERRMSAGLPIGMIPLAKYEAATARIREVYTATHRRGCPAAGRRAVHRLSDGRSARTRRLSTAAAAPRRDTRRTSRRRSGTTRWQSTRCLTATDKAAPEIRNSELGIEEFVGGGRRAASRLRARGVRGRVS